MPSLYMGDKSVLVLLDSVSLDSSMNVTGNRAAMAGRIPINGAKRCNLNDE